MHQKYGNTIKSNTLINGLGDGLVPNKRKAIIKNNSDPIHWRIHVSLALNVLTHWGQVTHICVSNLAIIGSENGLAPGRRQAIICTNAGILSIRPIGNNFYEILI